MRFHSNTTPAEFIDWLRDAAIKGGQPATFIDRIDELHDAQDLPEQLEKAEQELSEMEDNRDDLRDELATLADTLESAVDTLECLNDNPEGSFFGVADLERWQMALKAAQSALERHK